MGWKKDKGLLGAAAQRTDSHQMAHETEGLYKADARAQTTAAPQGGKEGTWQPALASDSNYVMSRGGHGQSPWAERVSSEKGCLLSVDFKGRGGLGESCHSKLLSFF